MASAKERRIERRRNEKRLGLSERQFAIYKSLLGRGYLYETAMNAARTS